jgi:AcrR family transcriptional regulator
VKRPDGRRLRSERTRQRILEAYLGLAFELSPRMPTARETAQRAGCAVRSVFEHFPDMHDLQVAAAGYAMDQVAALAPPVRPDGDRNARIEREVEMRARLCEVWGRLWRSLLANRGDSDELKVKIGRFQELRLNRLEDAFRPELGGLSDAERRQTLVALGILTDAGSWSSMRDSFGLSFDDARAVWVGSFQRLLPPTPSA